MGFSANVSSSFSALAEINGDVNVDGFAHGISGPTGSNDLRNKYLAGYATWTGASSLYVDTVLQAGRHPYTIKPLTNVQAAGKARSVLASVEVGQPSRLPSAGPSSRNRSWFISS